MTIEAEKDVICLTRIGKIVGLALRLMQNSVQPGMTTRELDRVGEAFLRQHGARSAPIITYNFPAATCICIDDEVSHGIPGDRIVREGDLVKIDVSAELDGYFADSHVTVAVAPISPRKQKLVDCAKSALETAIDAARAGRPVNEIGKTTELAVRRCGFKVVRELTGHGVGRGLHEPPTVPSCFVRQLNTRLRPGMVVAIEPHVALGRGDIVTADDGWTLKTRDGSPVASFEHTVVITADRPILLTAV
jgi:methionyl aminopeptidase